MFARKRRESNSQGCYPNCFQDRATRQCGLRFLVCVTGVLDARHDTATGNVRSRSRVGRIVSVSWVTNFLCNCFLDHTTLFVVFPHGGRLCYTAICVDRLWVRIYSCTHWTDCILCTHVGMGRVELPSVPYQRTVLTVVRHALGGRQGI